MEEVEKRSRRVQCKSCTIENLFYYYTLNHVFQDHCIQNSNCKVTIFFSRTGAISGAAIHKLGARVVVIIGGTISTIGLLVSSVAPSPWVLYVSAGLLAGMVLLSPFYT